MNKYDMIFESLQERVNNGELTVDDANRLNDLAYEKYVVNESKKDDDLAMIDDLRSKIEAGDVKLSKDCIEEIKELIGSEDDDKEEDKKEDKASDDDQADENGEGAAEEVTEAVKLPKENPFKKLKMKIEMSKLTKEDKAKVDALNEEYQRELKKLQEKFQDAQDLLEMKMERKYEKICAEFEKKYSKITGKE